MDFVLRQAGAEDLHALAFLEAQCFTAPWSESLLESELSDTVGVSKYCLVALDEDRMVAGYLCARTILDTADLLRIAVRPDLRRRGLAKALMREWLAFCRSGKVSTVFLEVRASNQKAIALYQKTGFTQQTVLKDYYEKPHENGILFSLEIK